MMRKTEFFWLPAWRFFKNIKSKDSVCPYKCSDDSSGIAAACNVPIVTSIAPKRIEEQKRAISTWLAQGFSPISVNYDDEIENLRRLFPEVRFLPAQTDSLPVLGKKRIFFNELFFHISTCTQQNCCRFAGIVNSDVSLYNIDIDLLSQQATSSLVFSRRADVKAYRHSEGVPYKYGFDAFFFRYELLCDFPQCNLALGEPWWDIALPLWAILHDRPIVACFPPLCFHVIHKTQWSTDSWVSMGKIVYDVFTPLLMRKHSLCPGLPETLQPAKTNSFSPAEFMREFAEFSTAIVNSVPTAVNFTRDVKSSLNKYNIQINRD
jgi:hypothetical protein